DASLYFIGRIRTPWIRREQCPKNARESDAICTLEIDPRFAQALTVVETCSHLVQLYWMNRSRHDLLLQVPRTHGEGCGACVLRSAAPSNADAMGVPRVVKAEGTQHAVLGLDWLDKTTVTGLQAYFASYRAFADAGLGWHSAQKG